ncbi:MAG: hypothetical protein HFH23_12825 [Ruminococcus sp.]|nr:hypothetical protein [Ruminococcus sp.]
MRRRKTWKNYICETLYCKPELNRKLLKLQKIFAEVYQALNPDEHCGRK